MQFLVDNNISPRLVTSLKQSNYNAVHVSEINMSKSSDEEIFFFAKENEMVIISADTDFGYILSEWQSPKPSIILFRYVSLNPDILIKYINNILENYSDEINSGHILIVEPNRIRIRALPLYQ